MSDYSDVSTSPARQTGQTAKQETQATAGHAKAAAGTVAGSAKEQARAVTGDAREQARNVVGELREHASQEADSQVKKTAGLLHQYADDLADMAQNGRSESPVRNLISQAADGGHRAADTLEQRGLGGLVQGLESFARRRPGAFLCGAALAGLAAGRLAKAEKKAHQNGSGGSSGETSSQGPPQQQGGFDGGSPYDGPAPGTPPLEAPGNPAVPGAPGAPGTAGTGRPEVT
ncbi:hypothetical protein V1J52_19305 [Streptomyces sp. TRM 70351]|uniref:hypothetical protein n=1 Tax=Streptomyces sp. TRM 70351 TaxID=3116552 RepID=UPI002E7B534C|nr:hypothetical protein [Streptomyces sp. TRM 70351]MEE1930302.1 hypothetical protein [Streptomyces sp. TRM 70351]